MKKHLLIGVLFLYLLNLNVAVAQVPDSCTFVEKDSIITIEMESTNLNGGYWVHSTDKPGYTGTGFIQYIGGDATGIPGKSQLSYTFKVKEAGRHSFKMRAFRDDYHDNDVWVRFPHGGVVTKVGNDSTGTHGSNWFKAVIGARDEWYGFVKTQLLGTAWGETFHDIYVDFPAPGVYTVQFSGRASGFRIDRFMMYYQKSSFFGMNINNPESAKIDCAPYVMPAGRPYLANPLPDQTVNADQPWSFTIPANTFGGGTSIDYAAYLGNMFQLPSWITFNRSNGTFTALPGYTNGGKYTILVVAKDNGYQAIDGFTLTVVGNDPPVMLAHLDDTTATVGTSFLYDIAPNFMDPNGHTLSYVVRTSSHVLPAWLSFNGTSFTGTPDISDIGSDTIYVEVSDGYTNAMTESFIIHVKPVVIQGTAKQIEKMNVRVFPNPVDQVINIQVQESGKGTLLLTDNMGRVHSTIENIELSNEISLDLSTMNMQPGVYFVRIKSNEKSSEYNGMVIKK